LSRFQNPELRPNRSTVAGKWFRKGLSVIVEKTAAMMQPQGLLIHVFAAAMLLQSPGVPDQAVIQRAARQYRLQIYHSFRTQREEYDRRKAAWDHVAAAWEAAGQRADQHPLLLEWLQEAIRASSPDTIGPLPELPDFGVPLKGPQPKPTTQEPALRPPTTLEVGRDSNVGRLASQRGSEPAEPASASSSFAPVLPRAGAVHSGPNQPPGQTASSEKADGRRASVTSLSTSSLPGVEPKELLVSTPAQRGGATGSSPAERSTSLPTKTTPPVAPKQRPSAVESPSVSRPTTPVLPYRPSQPEASHASPGQAQPALPSVVSVPPRAPSALIEPEHAIINQTELSARILGGNLALKECEAELDKDQPWTVERLAPLVERLKTVMIQRHDCALLCDLVPEAERSQLGVFESSQPVITALGKRILEATRRAESKDYPGTEAERKQELHALEQLARTLAATSDRR
jgi:hypothetical protein